MTINSRYSAFLAPTMAVPLSDCSVLFLLAIFIAQGAMANEFLVGGHSGWTNFDVKNLQTPNYARWAASQRVYEGDYVVFKYTPGAHNVNELPSRAAYQTCDFSSAKLLDSGSSGTFIWRANRAGTYYFACNFQVEEEGTHCSSGQKLAIQVFHRQKQDALPLSANSESSVLPILATAPSPTSRSTSPTAAPSSHSSSTQSTPTPSLSPPLSPAFSPVTPPATALPATVAAPPSQPISPPTTAPSPAVPPSSSPTSPVSMPSPATALSPSSASSAPVPAVSAGEPSPSPLLGSGQSPPLPSPSVNAGLSIVPCLWTFVSTLAFWLSLSR
eukprot:c20121_g1_i2 orf=413-1399(-)